MVQPQSVAHQAGLHRVWYWKPAAARAKSEVPEGKPGLNGNGLLSALHIIWYHLDIGCCSASNS